MKPYIHSGKSLDYSFRFPVTTNVGEVHFVESITKNNLGHREVVLVDAAKFLELWRREPYSVHGQELGFDDWAKDAKYPRADSFLRNSKNHRVTLAEVAFELKDGHNAYVHVGDGVTRIRWLIAHGAKSFPVCCSMTDADNLKAYAGIEDYPACSMRELFEIANAIPL